MSITWYWPTTTIPSEWNHGSLASEDGKFGGGKIRRQELIRFQFSHSRFGESIREQPHAQTEFIGVIYPSPERWLNPMVEDESKISNVDADDSIQTYYLRITPLLHLLHPWRWRLCPHCRRRLHHQRRHRFCRHLLLLLVLYDADQGLQNSNSIVIITTSEIVLATATAIGERRRKGNWSKWASADIDQR